MRTSPYNTCACKGKFTFKVNRRVRVSLGSSSYGILNSLFVVVAIDVVAVFVHEGWISVYDGTSISGMIDDLRIQVNMKTRAKFLE